MASATRPIMKRPATPVSLNPHPKPIVTMEEWEAKAPLTDLETRSVAGVKRASERSPLPSKPSATEPSSSTSRPSTPIARKLGPPSRTSTPRPHANHSLHPAQPIATPQQYYDWFSLVDRALAHSQEAHFRSHLAALAEHLDTCDGLARRIDEVDGAVGSMLDEWRAVEEGGKSLQEACAQLLEERSRLLDMEEAIGERLEYFQELEHATRMLNSPGESLVLQTDFLYMVERVDICIDYLRAHRHFREAEVYLLRFQQCMTRAMTLIKMYFVGSLRALTQDVSRRLSEKDVSATAQMHLLYTRVNSVSVQLAPLLAELERRAEAHPDELAALLSECHTAYFSARLSLLSSRLAEEIKGLDPSRTELVELTRSGCSYLKQLCTDEFNLFRQFFNTGEDKLYAYLENLCDYLYDDLRPRILHEPRLTALCEVCSVLQALMVLDVAPSPEEDEDEDADELVLDFEKPAGARRGLRSLHISHLLEMVLQDAQTRLFFKAQAVIQSDVRYYVPKPEDLAYPDKLVSARKLVSEPEGIREKESVSELFKLKSVERQETWFPTLRRTVWVLSQLHDYVKPAIFADIAQEAIALCRQSLLNAAETLRSKHGAPAPGAASASAGPAGLDAQLFLVRHLLILKEIAQSLDLDISAAERGPLSGVDYSLSVTDALTGLLGRTTALLPAGLLPSALLSFGASSSASDSTPDVRAGVDADLRRACEDLIASLAAALAAPLDAPATDPATLAALLRAFQGRRAVVLGSAVARMRLYLEDERTVSVLAGHVCERVVSAYERSLEAARAVPGCREGGEVEGVRVEGVAEVRDDLSRICENGAGVGTEKAGLGS